MLFEGSKRPSQESLGVPNDKGFLQTNSATQDLFMVIENDSYFPQIIKTGAGKEEPAKGRKGRPSLSAPVILDDGNFLGSFTEKPMLKSLSSTEVVLKQPPKPEHPLEEKTTVKNEAKGVSQLQSEQMEKRKEKFLEEPSPYQQRTIFTPRAGVYAQAPPSSRARWKNHQQSAVRRRSQALLMQKNGENTVESSFFTGLEGHDATDLFGLDLNEVLRITAGNMERRASGAVGESYSSRRSSLIALAAQGRERHPQASPRMLPERVVEDVQTNTPAHTRGLARKCGMRKVPRRGSRLRRRSSLYTVCPGAIVELPPGAYRFGSPFRGDRFAALSPCPTTNVERVLCYNAFGNPRNPAFILISGAGSNCRLWPDGFCLKLSTTGLFVVALDNRDAGLSTHWDSFPGLSMQKAALLKLLPSKTPPYTLTDMANDVLDLMSYLDISKAHLLGSSMGGMIAQKVAQLAPDRIRSLFLVATHCPGYRVESPKVKFLLSAMLDSPSNGSIEAAVDFYVRRRKDLIGDYTADTPEVREMFRKSIIRAPGDRKATERHFWAVQHEPSRERELRDLSRRHCFPVAVVHGRQDRLIPVANGKALHRIWEGSTYHCMERMGHNLPGELVDTMIDLVTDLVNSGEA